ncbi:hypothetical protein Q7P37_007968 [Cladosporium fusiforme]
MTRVNDPRNGICYFTATVGMHSSKQSACSLQLFQKMDLKDASPLFLYLVLSFHKSNHPPHGPHSTPSGCLLMSDSFHEDQSSTSPEQLACEVRKRLDFRTLLGHPHDRASPQLTEPFWQQGPDIAYPQSYYYPEQDLYTLFPLYYAWDPASMDSAPLVIGFKSRYGRPAADMSNNTSKIKRPRQTVKVYLEDDYVGEISLGVIVRFSKLAKATFPKPQGSLEKVVQSDKSAKVKTEKAVQADAEIEQGEKKSWADMTDADYADHEEDHKAPLEVEGRAVTSPASPAVEAASAEPLEPKGLAISVAGAWIQPDISVAKHILNWMQQNKRTRNNEPLLPLTPLPLSSIPLKALIDTYTGVLAYDLAPFPHDLRHEILTRITKQPTKAPEMQHLYEHLPVEDPILNRMVTAYFEHVEADHYSQTEITAIHTYVQDNAGDEGELNRHFNRVNRSRNRKLSREDAMKTLREGFENFAGPILDALPVEEGKDKGRKDSAAAEDDADADARRRKRRLQQSKGGVKGKGKAKAKADAPKDKAS